MQESTKRQPEEPVSQDMLTELLRTGARPLLVHALEAERAELLAHYAKQQDEHGRAIVVGNGYQPAREIQTGMGPVTVQVQVLKVRSRQGKPVSFRSVLVPPYVRKTASLEAAIPWLYLKGISRGEMQAALEALVGPGAKGLSASTVSRLKQTWREVLANLKARRMKAPKVAVGDGGMGFWSALEELYPTTRQQRCWVHKTRNVLNALPKCVEPKAKQALHEI